MESAADRRVYAALAAAVVVTFFAAGWAYWVPAHPGVDQNGYLVGGKLFAAHGSTAFRPADPFAFVGRMWVQARDGRCFPKYPLGLSVLYAAVLRLGGGVRGCFAVNPVAMPLGLAATFLLGRRLAGPSSFAGLLAVLIVATSPVCIGLTNNPNSHATAFAAVAWGMWCLLRWWDPPPVGPRAGLPGRHPSPRRLRYAVPAGLLLGAAVTIRYTEGLLLLPVAAVATLNVRRSWAGAAALLAAWAAPVAAMAVYNLHQMGTLTGYDPTNESTGFAWANFAANWDTMLRELGTTGLLFTLPFAVVGLVAAGRTDRSAALLLTLWAAPNLLLYTAYYWAPDSPTAISYLRFTLTAFPALATLAAVGLRWAAAGRAWGTVAVGLVAAVGCGGGLYVGLDQAANDAAVDAATLRAANAVRAIAPAGSVVFGPDRTLNYLQLVGDYQLYDTQQFDRLFVERLGEVDPNAPTGLQPQRAHAINNLLGDKSQPELLDAEAKLATAALAAGRRVFVLEAFNARTGVAVDRLATHGRFTTLIVGGWQEVPADRLNRKGRPPNPRRAARANAVGQWHIVELRPPVPLALPSKRGKAKARSQRAD